MHSGLYTVLVFLAIVPPLAPAQGGPAVVFRQNSIRVA
jgi:hypothetical protein